MTGQLARVHGEWLLMVHEHGRESLVATRHVQSIRGLGRYSSPSTTQSTVDLRFGLNLALRRVARERSPVRLHLVDGVIDGTIDRVGSDFCDVALHAANEPRRRGTVREVALVPIAALVAATRAA
ncbi:MAG TPA: hypothetical protein VHO01_12030 [Jatrophihabitans sp.]|nr:hypothetical protein [Jatrophihabitans sp.]